MSQNVPTAHQPTLDRHLFVNLSLGSVNDGLHDNIISCHEAGHLGEYNFSNQTKSE